MVNKTEEAPRLELYKEQILVPWRLLEGCYSNVHILNYRACLLAPGSSIHYHPSLGCPLSSAACPVPGTGLEPGEQESSSYEETVALPSVKSMGSIYDWPCSLSLPRPLDLPLKVG